VDRSADAIISAVAYLFNFSRKGAAPGRSLASQAGDLVQVGLWGIGEKTPLRSKLARGDRVLLYVGAPERSVIGHATLGSEVHEWTADEARHYPGSFTSGVSFAASEIWSQPLKLEDVLGQLELAKTNPNAQFFAGVIKITDRDFDRVVQRGTGSSPAPPADPPPRRPVGVVAETGGEELYLVAEKLRTFTESPNMAGFTEADTRAAFIDPLLAALGYSELGDIQRGVPVQSGQFADYVVRVGGKAAIVIEAKRLEHSPSAKDAGQVVGYCSNLGVRWGAVTNGQLIRVYDAPLLHTLPHERLIFELDLLDYEDREEFDAYVYPDLALLSKTELEAGEGLARRAAQEAVRDILTTHDSRTVAALRQELQTSKAMTVPESEVLDLISDLIG
jgi:hypothetical protein